MVTRTIIAVCFIFGGTHLFAASQDAEHEREENVCNAKATQLDRIECKLNMILAGQESKDSDPPKFDIVAVGKGTKALALDDRNVEQELRLSGLELRKRNWEHRWWCNIFRNCDTWFNTTYFVFDASTGSPVTWHFAESVADDNCNVQWDGQPNYNTRQNTVDMYGGWGKRDGKSRHVSTRMRWWTSNGYWFEAYIRSNTCP